MPKFNQLVSVHRYLESLSVVDSIRVSLISGDVVTFKLKLRNDAADLQRLIELGEVLEQLDLPSVNAQDDREVMMNYSYIDRGVLN